MKYTEIQKKILEDLTYSNCLSLKNSILQQHSNLYTEVSSTFRSVIERDKRENIGQKVGMLFLKEVFNNTANKTLSEYAKALSYHTELSNNYTTIVTIVCNLHSEYETATIETICYLAYVFDNYIGFMIEYLLAEKLKSEGLTVAINDYLDTKYKVDILVGSPYSCTAVAIQLKSYTHKNINRKVKQRQCEALNSFKNEYKQYNELSCIDNIETKFLFYDIENKGFRAVNDKVLVDTDIVYSGYYQYDRNEDWSILKRMDVPIILNIDSLINELKELLKIA